MDDTNENRDYNAELRDVEGRQYAYNFDLDIMHPFMMRAFAPYFSGESCLELGSSKGDFTLHLAQHFKQLTCVEASNDAVQVASKRLCSSVKFHINTFENCQLDDEFDNVILTHVLEHIDEPIKLLKKINDEWLTADGHLFLVCPNANAPSRQIAVKMGLIPNNSAVTPAEAAHGHRITYTLDTLERDCKAAGLRVVHRSGIFFKALANFQWDRLLQTDIVSPQYLEGCYELGQHYPDLCSSIFLLCKRGA